MNKNDIYYTKRATVFLNQEDFASLEHVLDTDCLIQKDEQEMTILYEDLLFYVKQLNNPPELAELEFSQEESGLLKEIESSLKKRVDEVIFLSK